MRLLNGMKRGATKLRWTGGGGACSAPVCVVNEPKRTGARSAAETLWISYKNPCAPFTREKCDVLSPFLKICMSVSILSFSENF
jgi:hypothetical protein